MSLGQLVIFIVVFFALAYGAYLLITHFITDAAAQKIVLAIVGIVLLIFFLGQFFPGILAFQVWK